MKKNISINISGIIFHIEEDGYERLKSYLDSISKYFSTFEDSQEIVADIENRIAEIFLARLKDGKQVINSEDIETLISTMGSISDFEAVDELEEMKAESAKDEPNFNTESSHEFHEQQRLRRDKGKRIFGGVASGIAQYFGIDAVWIRVLFLLLFFGFSALDTPIGGITLLVYIALWIALPGKIYRDEDRKKIRKMYRNPSQKVLGGVAGGLANYWGVDVTAIRLIFILLIIPGGFGIIAYIILWIILPEAKTITEKMEMQGEPVTLSNIESNIKKSLNVQEEKEESFITKVVLFPFRLIASLFKAIAMAFGPVLVFLVEFIRIVAGLFILMFGLSMVFSVVVGGGTLIGFFSSFSGFETGDLIPFELIREVVPSLSYVGIFGLIFIPGLLLIIVGLSIMIKRSLMKPVIGWIMLGLWIVSLIIVLITVPKAITNFGTEGEYNETETYYLDKSPVLTMQDVGMEGYQTTRLEIRSHQDSTMRLVKRFQARGQSRLDAANNAKMVTHQVRIQNDSIMVIDSNILFNEDAKFRAQELSLVLYMPYNKVFYMNENLKEILRNTLSRNGYRVSQMEGNQWMFDDNGKLTCLTCE